MMNQAALEVVSSFLPAGFKPDHEAVIVIEQDGNDREQVLLQLAEMVEILDGVDNRVAQSEAEREGIWNARRQFGSILVDLRKNVFSEDIAVPISRVPEMVRRFQALADKHGIQMPTVAHAGMATSTRPWFSRRSSGTSSGRSRPRSSATPSSSAAPSPPSTAWGPSSATSPPSSTAPMRSPGGAG